MSQSETPIVVHRFLHWKEKADVAKRAAAASALARAYLFSDMGFEERCAAEAALTELTDDPSPRVRMALAEALATSPRAPEQILIALLGDRFDIAALIAVRSPRIRETDLIDRVRYGDQRLQVLIAERSEVGRMLALALARYGGPDAAYALIGNPNARVCQECRKLLVERFGDDPNVRSALLDLTTLEPLLRYRLLDAASNALSNTPFVRAVIGADRATDTAEASLQRSLVQLLDHVHGVACEGLVDALREDGRLTTALILRSACHGHLDFISAVVADLTNGARTAVIDAFASARESQLHALLSKAQFNQQVATVLASAICAWRAVGQGRSSAGVQEITYAILQGVAEEVSGVHDPANDDIEGLLRAIYLDEMRKNARSHARAVANTVAA
ncbi:MAG: DUF2336 domain-containing protein [Pseudomonadota bacterium]